jgi:hypothetical protein
MSTRQVIGLAAFACVACCIGPILGVLGGVAALGVLGNAFIGVSELAIAAVAALAFVLVRRKRRTVSEPDNRSLTTRPELRRFRGSTQRHFRSGWLGRSRC